ncbi:MAG: DUF1697 domain-containing protein [Verrucomicrobiae bacterium]|nr:DUF1697 domain-containing protein [Verrucomicrobiae bacterium]
MASVIFFRAANVGGHQVFQPGVLAKELAAFGVSNIGAAGTFVVRENVTATKLRAEIHRRLPFQPELMIYPVRVIRQLVDSNPFHDAPAGKDMTYYVSILPKALRTLPTLPLDFPTPDTWEVKIHRITGQLVLCVQRPGKKKLYPNAVIEKHSGLSATTRNWNTFVKIAAVLQQ